MTCHTALALLEDYVDEELSPEQRAQIRQHLAECDQCRSEFESSVLLKELLKQRHVADPGQDYWTQTQDLVRARTVFRETSRYSFISLANRESAQRGAFMRSVVSVFASLVILFSAILLGSGGQHKLAQVSLTEPPIFVAAPLDDQFGTDNITVASTDENLKLARGVLLLGPPGVLGRFISPLDFASGIR